MEFERVVCSRADLVLWCLQLTMLTEEGFYPANRCRVIGSLLRAARLMSELLHSKPSTQDEGVKVCQCYAQMA
ncbi:hypothetical protein FRX31_027552 [Thalictrum thalictroides]|uniref:Uncharacterized protein n=1 Tax=Thalictrum thalictroides TaxID=46969 RepID=A0A7J6VE08_THATH|nr:hypothetical protein FRX31_027552 [Thalictrum thalictroides]